MSQDDNVNLDTSNETVDDTQADNQVADIDNNEDAQDDSVDESEDVETLKQLNTKLYERTKKAEGEVKSLKTKIKDFDKSSASSRIDALSPKDIALLGQLHEDDMDEVIEYAKFKGISIAETLKTPIMKTTLKEKSEERKSAQVANTGGGRRTSTKLAPEQLIEEARRGKIELKDDDWKALHEARAKGL